MKGIWYLIQGACPVTKRLEKGRVVWPSAAGRGGDDLARTDELSV
ncbi:hypothetical protein [Bradyrhizobium sp. 62B]